MQDDGDKNPNWDDLEHQILSRLDLPKEAAALGLRVADSTPNPKGWIAVHAYDREDKKPSAALNVSSVNGALGKYKDSASGEKAISFFDLAVAVAPGRFKDWRDARSQYAKQTGIDIPEDSSQSSRIEWCKWSDNIARIWCDAYKPGITPAALLAAGCRMCWWPATSHRPNKCIAFPAYKAPGAEPCNWALYRVDGQIFAEWTSKTGRTIPAHKVHTLRGGGDGWVIVGKWDATTITDVWQCEGPGDAAALAAILPAGHVAVSNIHGSNASPAGLPWEMFCGKRWWSIGDCDRPGQAGAKAHGGAAATEGCPARLVKLPYEVVESHGKDVRDWMQDGGSWEALQALAAASEVIVPSSTTNKHITNYRTEPGEKEGEFTKIALSIKEVGDQIHAATGGWPKDIDGLLFAPGRAPQGVTDSKAIWTLDNVDDLFSWLQTACSVQWTESNCLNASAVRRKEIYSYLLQYSQRSYLGVSWLPHHPEIPGLYYVPRKIPPSDGSAILEFLEHLNPETENDRMLLLAACLTPGWGGEPGSRPAFLFTSDHGRGAGKTQTAEAIADIWGGVISFGFNRKRLEDFKSRLLDNSTLPLRCVLADNLKGTISSADLEELITTKVLDGKRMYHGDYRRQNLLTWFVTANSPAFSKDLADRSVIIRIGKQKSGDFAGWLTEWMGANRMRMIADILAILSAPDRSKIEPENLDRWNAWQRGVLQKLPGANEIAKHVSSQRPGVDIDTDEADEIAEILIDFIGMIRKAESRQFVDPDTESVALPNSVLYDLLRHFFREPHAPDRVIRGKLNNLLGVGRLSSLKPNPSRKYGRSFVWYGAGTQKGTLRTHYPYSAEWQETSGVRFESVDVKQFCERRVA